ncbi:MAG: hypothetical protein JWN44_6780 [Myxococcales bacterium]|nr:hypothetical protein [Myxococcales bacterium]
MTRFALAVTALALTGCPALDPNRGLSSTQPPAQLLDYDEFVCAVEPVLIRRCSYLACHGNVDHALRVYSPGKLRAGVAETRNQRDGRLTAAEVEANFESAVGTVYAASADDRAAGNDRVPLLAKPTAARVGGAEHHGVGIFPVPPAQSLDHDPEWQALASWVAGKKQPSPPTVDCAALFTTMGLSPR